MKHLLILSVMSKPLSASEGRVGPSLLELLQFLYICCNKSLKFTHRQFDNVLVLQIKNQQTLFQMLMSALNGCDKQYGCTLLKCDFREKRER